MDTLLRHHRDTLITQAKDIQAPFFFYDIDALQHHIKSLQQWPVTLWYALKANPLSSVIKTLAQEGVRFDVASPGECQQVLKQNIPAKNILVTGPAKTEDNFAFYLEQGVETFVLESHAQVKALNHIAKRSNKKPRALLRVQLTWEGAERNVLGGCGLTPFGMMPEDWASLSLSEHASIEFVGLHIFQFANILDPNKLKTIWRGVIEPLQKLANQLQLPFTVLDLGGGLGIPYSRDEKNLTPETVQAVLQELKTQLPKQAIWLELGRYAIGRFGCYVTKVLERKRSRGQELLVLEGGINHLMRPAITNQPFPASLLRESKAETMSYQLHGPLCTSLDMLGTHELPSDIEPGDHLVFSQAGAYAFTESMPFFLCHTLPGEVVWRNNQVEVMRTPENPSNWLR